MKKIQILGTGCPKCNMLKANAETAIKELGIDAEIEKISDIKEIMNFGVMSTPAIAIDGKVISAGKVLKPEDIKKHLS
ncbi:MAG TPA: thioredoxin family protein [Desulfomonilia bacterium]